MEKNTLLFCQGEVGKEFLVILHGAVDLFIQVSQGPPTTTAPPSYHPPLHQRTALSCANNLTCGRPRPVKFSKRKEMNVLWCHRFVEPYDIIRQRQHTNTPAHDPLPPATHSHTHTQTTHNIYSTPPTTPTTSPFSDEYFEAFPTHEVRRDYLSGYLGQLLMTLSQPKTEFGEMSLLSKGGVRNTSAVVSQQSTLLIVPDAVYQV